ncbi:MAG: hypothetical protein E7349_02835 [Clostridiales bacterium]|nr:hypothetical protein [Clostridiales bacterium]
MAELNKDVMGKQEEKSERKVFIVNCNKCGAALKVKDGALAYICGACSHVFQIRKIEKIITDDGLEVKLEEPTAPAEEPLDIPVQSDISNVEEAKEDIKEETVEMVAEETQPAVEETAAEEKEEMQAVEEPTVKEKTSEMLTWEPEVDEGEEEGWEDDDRQRELPIWQEEEAEEGWDEE